MCFAQGIKIPEYTPMYIEISEINKIKDKRKELNLEISAKDIFTKNSELKIHEPLKFIGSITLISEIFYLEGQIKGDLLLTCSRCLDEFKYSIDIEVEEKFSLVSHNEDDSIIFIDSDKLNLSDIIENNILMALPIKKLCKEDCNGLCQVCGINKNHSLCNCEQNDIDPRLAKLKDLFSID